MLNINPQISTSPALFPSVQEKRPLTVSIVVSEPRLNKRIWLRRKIQNYEQYRYSVSIRDFYISEISECIFLTVSFPWRKCLKLHLFFYQTLSAYQIFEIITAQRIFVALYRTWIKNFLLFYLEPAGTLPFTCSNPNALHMPRGSSRPGMLCRGPRGDEFAIADQGYMCICGSYHCDGVPIYQTRAK